MCWHGSWCSGRMTCHHVALCARTLWHTRVHRWARVGTHVNLCACGASILVDWSKFAQILPRGRSEFKGKIRWNQGEIRDQSRSNCFAIESKRGGDHEELKILLQIRLIASRINQKLKNKGENTSVLKRILAQKFGLFDAIVGADETWPWFRKSWPWFRGNRGLDFAARKTRSRLIVAMIARRSGHNRAAIGLRSRRDRTTIVSRSGLDISVIRWRSRDRSRLRVWWRSNAPSPSTCQ